MLLTSFPVASPASEFASIVVSSCSQSSISTSCDSSTYFSFFDILGIVELFYEVSDHRIHFPSSSMISTPSSRILLSFLLTCFAAPHTLIPIARIILPFFHSSCFCFCCSSSTCSLCLSLPLPFFLHVSSSFLQFPALLFDSLITTDLSKKKKTLIPLSSFTASDFLFMEFQAVWLVSPRLFSSSAASKPPCWLLLSHLLWEVPALWLASFPPCSASKPSCLLIDLSSCGLFLCPFNSFFL